MRKHLAGIANIETNSILQDPRFAEVIGSSHEEAMVPVRVFCLIVTKPCCRNELLSSHPFMAEECISAKTRQKEASLAGAECKRSIGASAEVMSVPNREVSA